MIQNFKICTRIIPGSLIHITENNKKVTGYENYEGLIVDYILQRDIVSKKFPSLFVDFDYTGDRGYTIFGHIQVTNLNYDLYSSLSYVKHDYGERWYVRLDLDVNWFNVKDDSMKINIFTECFHGSIGRKALHRGFNIMYKFSEIFPSFSYTLLYTWYKGIN